MFEESFSDEAEAFGVLGDDIIGSLLLLMQDPADLFVDELRRVVAVLAARTHEVVAEEGLLLAAPGLRTNTF